MTNTIDPFDRSEALPTLYRVRVRAEVEAASRAALEATGIVLPQSLRPWGEVIAEGADGLTVRWPGYGWPVEGLAASDFEREGL